MPLNIPTTQTIIDRALSFLESYLSQLAPNNEKSFLRVLARLLGMLHTELYKLNVESTKQNLALTATGTDLDRIGQEYDVIRKPSEAAILTITIPGTETTVIPTTIDYVGIPNTIRYEPTAPATVVGGIATSNVTAQTLGVIGNLNVADTLTIGTQVAGIETIATVTEVKNVGTETETDDVYRERILSDIRTTTGGGNGADNKSWAEEVSGVKEAYPYSGEPNAVLPGLDAVASDPGDRVVFVEADASIDADGVAPGALLTEVRASLTTDPVTGFGRQPLGLTDDTLFVETITRVPLYVEITGFDAGTGVAVDIKGDIETALIAYFRDVTMFVMSVDLPSVRNDTITASTISAVIQGVLSAGDAFITSVSFDDEFPLVSPIPSKTLEPGELVKLADTNGITYV